MPAQWMQYGAALLLVHALSGCSSEEAPPPVENRTNEAAASTPAPVDDGRPIVVAFGNSLFAGYQLGRDEGFVPVLEEALKERGEDVRVFNAAVSGDTSAAGRQRLAFMLDGLPRDPALVIVELGGNDMLRGIGPQQTRENIDAILAELKQRGVPAMLAGMVAPANMGPDYVNEFNSIYNDLAAKYDVPLYPFILEGVVTDSSLMLADDIHPNADGVKEMVKRIAPEVDAALERE